jgi:hypothetical protein
MSRDLFSMAEAIERRAVVRVEEGMDWSRRPA